VIQLSARSCHENLTRKRGTRRLVGASCLY
jgi:hypothetical protein